MLCRFYGVYKIKIKYQQVISVVVMDNIMGQNPEDVIRTYDLKGSTFQRIKTGPSNPLSVLKDLNFLENSQDRVNVPEKTKRDILRRIYKDKEFLKSQKLMDYSLLLYVLKKPDFEDGS